MKTLNKYFDHTLLKPEATKQDIAKLCSEAIENNFYSVCVNSFYVPYAATQLAGSDVKIAAVVGFPLGACTTATKVFETEEVCKNGASEIDMVINIGQLKDMNYDFVLEDIKSIVDRASDYGAIVKVIIETCLLNDEEKVKACELSKIAGAHYVKTSTGFSSGGATAHDVKLMKESIGDDMKVKASGGIRDYDTVITMIDAGADRIGASAGVEIMKESNKK